MIGRVLLTILLAPAGAAAGGWYHGNGGNTVLCADGRDGIFDRNGATLLDLWLGSKDGWTYGKLRELRPLDLKSAFALAVNRYFRRSPELSSRFTEWFRADAENPNLVELAPLPGSADRISPACRMEQAAVQDFPMFWQPWPARPRLRISRDVWNGTSIRAPLPTDLKTALLIHEYVLYVQKTLNAPTQPCPIVPTRRLTAYFLSDQALRASEDEWLEGWDRAVRSAWCRTE